MSVLPVGISGEEAGYQIERSLRFNSADSAYLNRTPASAGNRKTWTWSGWVKRGSLGGIQMLFASYFANNDNSQTQVVINSDNTVGISFFNFSAVATTQLFRDPSAWYHLVFAFDTTQSTASNRVKVYVNGSQVTAFSVDARSSITQNGDYAINAAQAHFIGYGNFSNSYLNGYLTEINFIDGQALTPTSFGEFNSDTGVWQPKKYTGTYGTNGFYLNFSDNSGTTSTTLGKDSSGNGNNWTPNNFSVTAGAGNDSLVDSPTRYGTDTGAGGEVRGNYATLNPLSQGTGTITISNGNLDVAVTTFTAFGTMAVSSGKWYWEVTIGTNGAYLTPGIAAITVQNNVYLYQANPAVSYYGFDGEKYVNGSNSAYGATFTNGDVIGIAFDADNNQITFYKNNSSQGTITGLTSGQTWVPAISTGDNSTSRSAVMNFGQRPFEYTAPSGFKALVTTNLPTPTIEDGGEYFNAILYTGTGSSNARTGVGFQPDLVWIKERNASADHALYDAVRGVQQQLESNTTTDETTESTGLTAFGSDGFTVGSLAQVNTNNDTYVAWNWKANGAGVSNTAGTITSTVSVNTTSGFSIVTYTGTGANATVGHGLGVAPSMVIVKRRTGGIQNWIVWHTAIAANEYLYLNLTNAKATGAWNNTAPTSTVFSLDTATEYNATGSTYVAYCFAEVPGYSAFGSYTGNGSADGPFVYTGFLPRYVMIKQSSAAGENWTVYDSARNTYNITNSVLFPDTNSAEFTSTSFVPIDLLSNGFKIRTDGAGRNANGATYIFAAFAESPFAYSLAR